MNKNSEILTANQKRILVRLGEEPSFREAFYFTGGTPLAAFFLHHRFSEDLDFFSEAEVDTFALATLLKTLTQEKLIREYEYQQSFNRNLYFLDIETETVKLECTYFPFPRIEQGEEHFGLKTDTALDIAVNKLFSIYQRTKARDYIDLYLLAKNKGYTISDLVANAKVKFDWHVDPIQLGAQFLKAAEAEDMPRMIIELPEAEWQGFFTEEAKRLESEIME